MDWDKGGPQIAETGKDYIRTMGAGMDDLCELLSVESSKFKSKDFCSEIYRYINKEHRLLYTNITNYIFSLNDEQFGILQTNLDQTVNFIFSDDFEQNFAEEMRIDEANCVRVKKIILKIWDHVNLARRQYILFQRKNDEYSKIVDNKMEIAEARISKDMNSQLLSLVAIFTALSFLVFGGVSSLDNILAGARDIPLLKLILTGDVWCFCIMNLIFSFMYFVSKMTGLKIKSTENVNANLVQKYPLVFWSNFVIVLLFIISAWVYFTNAYGYVREISKKCEIISIVIALLGLLLIIVIAGAVGYILWKKLKESQ